MDIVEFRKKHIKSENWGNHIHADIIINGKSFADIAEEHERIAAVKGTGKYEAFEYVYDYADDLYDALANNSTLYSYDGVQKPVMICAGCHEPECWGLWVSIDMNDDCVIWHDIKNPHMAVIKPGKTKFWIYDEFPSFRFDKKEYFTAMSNLKYIAEEAHHFRKLSYTERNSFEGFEYK